MEALARIGESSPLVAELLGERDQLRDKIASLQEEQVELMADLDKAVNKVPAARTRPRRRLHAPRFRTPCCI